MRTHGLERKGVRNIAKAICDLVVNNAAMTMSRHFNGFRIITFETDDVSCAKRRKMLMHMLDLDLPVIAEITGSCFVNPALCVLADIGLATDGSIWSDSHVRGNYVLLTA